MRDTSLLAFQQLTHISRKQKVVLKDISDNPDTTAKEVGKRLDWPINCVTGRITELEDKGAIVSTGKLLQANNRSAHTWRVR